MQLAQFKSRLHRTVPPTTKESSSDCKQQCSAARTRSDNMPPQVTRSPQWPVKMNFCFPIISATPMPLNNARTQTKHSLFRSKCSQEPQTHQEVNKFHQTVVLWLIRLPCWLEVCNTYFVLATQRCLNPNCLFADRQKVFHSDTESFACDCGAREHARLAS